MTIASSIDLPEALRDRRILVTGAAGAIGRVLSECLQSYGAHVIAVDDLSTSPRWRAPAGDGIDFIEGSVLDEQLVTKVFDRAPEYVFHLACSFGNQRSVENTRRDLEVNVAGTVNVLEAAAKADVIRFVHASNGCSIYSEQATLPLHENSLSMSDPATPHQAGKASAELYVRYFSKSGRVRTCIARLFTVYGPWELPGQYQNALPNFLLLALSGQTIQLTGALRQSRDFCYVTDVVDGILRCAVSQEAVGRAYNIASGREVTIPSLVGLIQRICESDSEVLDREKRHWDQRDRIVASIDLARRELGFSPKVSLESGVQETAEWYRQHWDSVCDHADFPSGRSNAVPGGAFVDLAAARLKR